MNQRPSIVSFTAAQPEQNWDHPYFTPRSLRDLIEDEPVEETGEVPDELLDQDRDQEAADPELRALLRETLRRQEAFGPLIMAAASLSKPAREHRLQRRPSAVVATAWSLAIAVALATLAVLTTPDGADAAVQPAAAVRAPLRAGA